MKFLLLLALFVVFMATETEGGQVEDAITLLFNIMDSDKDGTISMDEFINMSMSGTSFRDYSHETSATEIQKIFHFSHPEQQAKGAVCI